MVHGGQADVFVHPAVTGNVVGVEQFVVVGQVAAARPRDLRVADVGIAIGLQHAADHYRRGVVGDVVKEGMARAHGIGQADGGRAVAFDQLGHVIGGAGDAVLAIVDAHHHLRHAIGPTQEVAIGIGGQQRHVVHVGVSQVDAQHVTGLGLDHGPSGHAAIFAVAVVARAELAIGAQVAVGDQTAGGDRVAGRIEGIFAQEHLVRRVRAVGLALVHERRSGVGLAIVGRAHHAVRAGGTHGTRQHHEVGLAVRIEQRIVQLQRNEHDLVGVLGHQVQAVVEELAEEGHPRVEACGQAHIRRFVGNEEHFLVIVGAEHPIQAGADDRGCAAVGFDGRRVVGGLVDDQVADDPRLRVDHGAGAAVVRPKRRVEQAQEGVVGRTELALVGDQVVEAAIHRAQAKWHLAVG
ncbi:hypothetical protein D3C81_845090 [compost metagenome]